MAIENRREGLEPEVTDQGTLLQNGRSSRREVLEEIRAGIIKHRGSLDGLLAEFLAERREEARREMEGV